MPRFIPSKKRDTSATIYFRVRHSTERGNKSKATGRGIKFAVIAT